MDEAEVFALLMAGAITIAAWVMTAHAPMHRMYFRRNPGPGIVRLAILLSLLWIFIVCLFWADESVSGVYILFYLSLGYAAVKMFGHAGSRLIGFHYRIDVLERRNVSAALVVGGFTLATGLIFGGSLWGDADPVGDDEGGWWIVGAFFLLGWVFLVAAFRLYLWREGRKLSGSARALRLSHDIEDGKAASFFLLAAGVTLTDAVSGDFWGWRHGLLSFGVLAGLLLAHEAFAGVAGRGGGGPEGAEGPASDGSSGGVATVDRPGARAMEGFFYLFLAFAAWGANRLLDLFLGGG